MDGFEHASAVAGSRQNNCSSVSVGSPNGDAPDEPFLARADRWRKKELSHPDDRQACIGAVNSGMAKILHAHQSAIERGFEGCTTPLDEPSLQHAVVAHNGLLRQWHSMLSFQARLEQMRLDNEKLAAERELEPQPSKAR